MKTTRMKKKKGEGRKVKREGREEEEVEEEKKTRKIKTPRKAEMVKLILNIQLKMKVME
jgi:hypothetical protein